MALHYGNRNLISTQSKSRSFSILLTVMRSRKPLSIIQYTNSGHSKHRVRSVISKTARWSENCTGHEKYDLCISTTSVENIFPIIHI